MDLSKLEGKRSTIVLALLVGLVGGLTYFAFQDPISDYFSDLTNNVTQTLIPPAAPQDQIVLIDEYVTPAPSFTPFYSSVRDEIVENSTRNIYIYNIPDNKYSGSGYIVFNRVDKDVTDPELATYLGLDSVVMNNGSYFVIYSEDPFSTIGRWNFAVNVEGDWFMTQRGIYDTGGTWDHDLILSNLVYQSNTGFLI